MWRGKKRNNKLNIAKGVVIESAYLRNWKQEATNEITTRTWWPCSHGS